MQINIPIEEVALIVSFICGLVFGYFLHWFLKGEQPKDDHFPNNH